VAIVDGKLKESTALLKALRSVGQATQVTSGSAVVMSNQPVPVQAIRREAYLAGSSTTTTQYGEEKQLTPGEITTGFAMTVIPHIMEGRRVVLQYTINLSNLDDLVEFSSGDATIQLPKVSSRSFSQRMTLKMGQTLVLAGFEQEIDGKNTSGGFLGIGRSRGYKKSLMVITISTESGDV
jgi:type IVB pilus formation R64 PilN family outer membrane protein